MSTVAPGELRSLFLFEKLPEAELRWISEHGSTETFAADTGLVAEGDPATCFSVLLSGTISMTRRVGGDEVELARTDQHGVYFGATQFLAGQADEQLYLASVRAITEVTVFQLPAAEFATWFRERYAMAAHLLEGMFLGMRSNEERVGQRNRLLALGRLSAGLTHELNNPAAAAVRATAALRERVAETRHKLAMLAKGDIDAGLLDRLILTQEKWVDDAVHAARLSAIETADREDALGDWLDERGVGAAWTLAPVFVQAGITVGALEEVAAAVGPPYLQGALLWLGCAVETELLMGEIEEATTRVSSLVAAAKEYSQVDRAPYQWVDVHQGLDSTLVMLNNKIGVGVRVVKEYDANLPRIPVYASELNQVWTNLIDNAAGAMAGQGTLTVRTALEGDRVLVEIADTGPGVPEQIRNRVFEPFFTTKPVGEGTGLGLDISWRIVVNRHHGELRLVSAPGDTRFQVLLPLSEQPAD